jgi:hypothetical protein
VIAEINFMSEENRKQPDKKIKSSLSKASAAEEINAGDLGEKPPRVNPEAFSPSKSSVKKNVNKYGLRNGL